MQLKRKPLTEAILVIMALSAAHAAETDPAAAPAAELSAAQNVLPEVTVKASEIRESAYGPVEGYCAERTGTATKTDTPIRETPAAIQVVPKQVIEDQQATRVTDVIQNVSSVRPGSSFGNRGDSFIVRGFQTFLSARDGFVANQLFDDTGFIDLANIERVEILKGPASVLYGLGDPGGLVNLVTKRPLREAQYKLGAQMGSYEFYRTEVDLSQPLNADGSLAFRVSAAYQDWDSFRDFFKKSERTFVAPVLGWQPSESTKVLVDFEYTDQEMPFDRGLVALGDGVADIPIDRYLGEAFSSNDLQGSRSRYIIEHEVNSTWLLRQTGRYQESEVRRFSADPRGLQADNRTLNRRARDQRDDSDQWSLQLEAVGDFTHAYIGHKVLLGVETSKGQKEVLLARAPLASIDIFNPVYGAEPQGLGAPTLLSDQGLETTDNRFAVGNRIQGVPRASGSLWMTREFRSGDWKGFGFGAGVFAASKREGDLNNSYRVPGYARVDASLFYRGDGCRTALGVKNVLDKEYIESPVSRTEVYPGAPRTVMATVEVKL